MTRYFATALLCVLAALIDSSSGFALDGPLFHFEQKSGPYSVGLKVIEQYDYSRIYRPSTDEMGKPFHGERARPLQTLIWYPANHSSTRSMTFGDYVNLWATEASFGHPRTTAKEKEWRVALRPALATPLWAVRDAPLASGRFPVVIYAPGASNMSWENADLCEYLASHGYLVIASADMGETTRDMTFDLAGINVQARDISFLIGYAQTVPDANMAEVAVVGHSWGGFSNVFAAARDNRIDALVALDGSMRYFPSLVKQAGDVHPDQMTIPLLYFAQRNLSLEDQNRYLLEADRNAPSVLNAWTHGDLVFAHMLGLSHSSFSSTYQRNEDCWWQLIHVSPMTLGDYGREDAMIGYGWVARYTLRFLDAYLKHDADAMAFLKRNPADNDVPPHVMAVAYRPATGGPLSFDGFRAEIYAHGFEHAIDIYAAFQKQKSDFTLDELRVHDWANRLIADDHLPEAIILLNLDVQVHPESSGAYVSLSDAYAMSGQRQLAVECLEKALELNPNNGNATRKLNGLEGR